MAAGNSHPDDNTVARGGMKSNLREIRSPMRGEAAVVVVVVLCRLNLASSFVACVIQYLLLLLLLLLPPPLSHLLLRFPYLGPSWYQARRRYRPGSMASRGNHSNQIGGQHRHYYYPYDCCPGLEVIEVVVMDDECDGREEREEYRQSGE